MRIRQLIIPIFLNGCGGGPSPGDAPEVAPAPIESAANAPEDRPFGMDSTTVALLEPCRLRALATCLAAKQRFQAGLPARHVLFVVTRLRDDRSLAPP